jgi:hypothetical protein
VSPTYTVAVPAADSRSASATLAAAGSVAYTVALDAFSPDDPALAADGKDYCSLVGSNMASPWWGAYTAFLTAHGADAADAEFTATDNLVAAPTGVVPRESALFNQLRRANPRCRMKRFRTPAGCTSIRFKLAGRCWAANFDTAETIVLALYRTTDLTSLVASQPVTLLAGSTAAAVDFAVTGDTEFVAVAWFNHPTLGTHGSDGGTSARAYLSRCVIEPHGAAMEEPFDRPFWGFERAPWPWLSTANLNAPQPKGWGTDPTPNGATSDTVGDTHQCAPFVIRCAGAVAVEYVAEPTAYPEWARIVMRTAPIGTTRGDQAPTATMLPAISPAPPSIAARRLERVALSSAWRLVMLESPQSGKVTRCYVPAYAGTQLEPPPNPPRTDLALTDSIGNGYNEATAVGAYEILRGQWPGQLVINGSGGTALASYGYLGIGGVLSTVPSDLELRAKLRARVLACTPRPTRAIVQVVTNDWGLAGLTDVNFGAGLDAVVVEARDVWHVDAVDIVLAINRADENTPNAGGVILETFRTKARAVAAAYPGFARIIDARVPLPISVPDTVHPDGTPAGYPRYAAQAGPQFFAA